jgi:bifunctional aspartokinase / homoserine dehydrogenase 1
MKVMKFGGTSVGSVDSILTIKQIVGSAEEPVVVVVSAVGGVTDQLIETTKLATAGDLEYLKAFNAIRARHEELLNGLFTNETLAAVQFQVDQQLDELGNIFKGLYLIQDCSAKTSDTIVSYGERISSLFISKLLNAEHFDARKFIQTDEQFGKHIVNFEQTALKIKEAFAVMPKVTVVGGFISSNVLTGETTNLGRGGSDYTAAILAADLHASLLEIWTDVDGFMTADPRVINNAYVIEKLSYVEAMELCNFGAKVIYPPTIFPAYHKNIPIKIKNTFNPDAPGTYISCDKPTNGEGKSIKGISSISDTSLITIEGLGMVGVIGVNYRIFKVLAKAGISVFLVSQASSENTTSIGVRSSDAESAVRVLQQEFKAEMDMGEINKIFAENDLATVAIVGENMKRTTGIAGKLFGTLGRNGINVIACAQGASETNISFVTNVSSLRKALNVIHDSFFLSEYQVMNIFLTGIGTVGGSLLDQIKQQQPLLMKQNGLKLNVVGIADINKAIFDRDGINLENYKDALYKEGIPTSPDLLKEEILKMNIFNSVFVDCTASPQIAGLYQELLEHNVSVVAANKIAASSEYDNYMGLKNLARKKGIKYLFETNVGAGLPIINTINNLINSGDRILKMEAVLSGTLNFIFNTISSEIPLSQSIKMAQEARYSEPDPRIDLSGKDVIRKLVILAREAGYKVEQDDVVKNLFVPDKYFQGTLDDFWASIGEMDEDFEAKRKVLENQSKRWRFVAKMENGACTVGLQEVSSSHPFYDLEGSNNIILITTERYLQYPMMIKGYGAGASVTAAGVFADIISIANIR